MSKLKDYFAKKRKYRQQEKDAIKKQKELEKEIDKEYKEKYGKKDHDDIPNKLAKALAKFFDILWPDDEEQIENELNEYLTDEEKKKIEEEKKEEKKVVIFATTFILSFITIITVLMVTYAYFNRTEYEKGDFCYEETVLSGPGPDDGSGLRQRFHGRKERTAKGLR